MTTTSTDRAPSPQDFKRPASRLFVATVLVLTMGAGMWLCYQQQQQQRQLADLTEQLRALKQSSPSAPVPVEPRLTALEQKVAELERRPPPPPPPPFEARLATLETEVARLKSVDVSAFSKRLDASEQKQKQQEKQLASLEQAQKDAATTQVKIANRQIEMVDQINKIIKILPDNRKN